MRPLNQAIRDDYLSQEKVSRRYFQIRSKDKLDEMPERLMFEVVELKGIGPLWLWRNRERRFCALQRLHNSNKPPQNITFNSPGGSVYEALELGRFIRSNDMQSFMLPEIIAFRHARMLPRNSLAYENSAVGMQHYFDESVIATFMG